MRIPERDEETFLSLLDNVGMHIFYSFLCKCELFTSRFRVPKLTGIFTEEKCFL